MTTSPTVPLDPSATWIAVGNGPSAVRRPLGALIDAHDNVVRFNRYETAGHEDFVGSRTTHWATHGLPFAGGGDRKTPMAPGPAASRPEAAILIHPKVPCPIEVAAVTNIRAGLLAEVTDRLGLGAGTMPTTGIVTIYYLLRDIGVRRLHLVGFDGFSKRLAKNHHYWDSKAYKRPKEHDGDAELRLLRHWAAVGRVAFLSCLAVGFFAV